MLIGELAGRVQTTTRALRYYEEQGLLRPRRDSNGYRVYDDEAVLRVHQIRGLLEAGFGSETVAKLLPCAHGDEPAVDLCPTVVAEMQRTLDAIEHKLATLRRRRHAVSSLLAAT